MTPGSTKPRLLLLLLCLAAFAAPALAPAADMTDALRGAPIDVTTTPPVLANPDNSDLRSVRNYAMQPPVIPHKIDGYQLDKNANRCMFCHTRTRTQESQAPMISVTHFMGRDGNFLAELSPRRYFCLQCHVPQTTLKPPVDNTFIDVDQMLYGAQSSEPTPPRTAQQRGR